MNLKDNLPKENRYKEKSEEEEVDE